MKKIILLAVLLTLLFGINKSKAQVNNVGTTVSTDADQHANSSINSTVNNSMDKAENTLKGLFKKKKKPTAADSAKNKTTTMATTGTPGATGSQPAMGLDAYQNYDFVPGEKIIFADDLSSDQNGEFPAHWKLIGGQAVVNQVDAKPSLLLSEHNAEIGPRMKTDNYLPEDGFTFEFDFIYKKYPDAGYLTDYFSDPLGVEFYYKDPTGAHSNPSYRVIFARDKVQIANFERSYPDALLSGFDQKWHHAAIIYKNGQMKVYVDQYRVCVDPNIDTKPDRITFDDLGFSKNNPIVFANVKLAEGGGMNMIGKKFTDAKIVTHGINFDVNKATIKPESLGTLNEIVQIMQDNPDIKFEVGGYTDSDGGDDINLKLSQARADAVRMQLINMHISADRLTAKGYGSAKPLSDNTTLEGKANNRRVEFVKL